MDNVAFLRILKKDQARYSFYLCAIIIAKHTKTRRVERTAGNSINVTITELLDGGVSDKEAEELHGFGWYVDDYGYLAFNVLDELWDETND